MSLDNKKLNLNVVFVSREVQMYFYYYKDYSRWLHTSLLYSMHQKVGQSKIIDNLDKKYLSTM